MRSYLAMELMGTIWFAGAIIAKSEDMTVVWNWCMAMTFFYFLRAFINYFVKKEISDAKKGHYVAGPRGDAIFVRNRPTTCGDDGELPPYRPG